MSLPVYDETIQCSHCGTVFPLPGRQCDCTLGWKGLAEPPATVSLYLPTWKGAAEPPAAVSLYWTMTTGAIAHLDLKYEGTSWECAWSSQTKTRLKLDLHGRACGDAETLAAGISAVIRCMYPDNLNSVLLDVQEGVGQDITEEVRSILYRHSYS